MSSRVLVIRLGALGDLFHVSPALAALKRARPQSELHVLTGPAYEKLVASFEGVDRVWVWDKARGWAGWWDLATCLRSAGFDTVINLHPSFKSWLLAQAIRPRAQVIYRKEKLSVKGREQRQVARRHAVADFARPFQQAFDLPDSAFTGLPRWHPHLEAPIPKPPGERWIGLIPGVGGKRANRAWPEASYRELIDRLLADPAVRIRLLGGADEYALAQRLMEAQNGRVRNECGQLDLFGTAALLSQCDVVIGGDTGPTHMAAALGVPVIALFGPTNPARTGPVGENAVTVLIPPPDMACWPCELAECPLPGEQKLACMRDISVEAVLSACQQA